MTSDSTVGEYVPDLGIWEWGLSSVWPPLKQVQYLTTELSQSALSFTVQILYGAEKYVIFISFFFHSLGTHDGNVLHLSENWNDLWINSSWCIGGTVCYFLYGNWLSVALKWTLTTSGLTLWRFQLFLQEGPVFASVFLIVRSRCCCTHVKQMTESLSLGKGPVMWCIQSMIYILICQQKQ